MNTYGILMVILYAVGSYFNMARTGFFTEFGFSSAAGSRPEKSYGYSPSYGYWGVTRLISIITSYIY